MYKRHYDSNTTDRRLGSGGTPCMHEIGLRSYSRVTPI